jgi:hypothetical protein
LFFSCCDSVAAHFKHAATSQSRRTPTVETCVDNTAKNGACGLIMGSNTCSILMESPQIGGCTEGRHEIKIPAWSGKTTDGLLASPQDRHKTAKMMSYEDAS